MTWASFLANPGTNYLLPGLTFVAIGTLIATFKTLTNHQPIAWYLILGDLLLTIIGLGLTYGPEPNNLSWLPMGALSALSMLAGLAVRPRRPATS